MKPRPTIIIFRTGGIGDVILSTVSLTLLAKLVPEAKIFWAGRGSTIELVKAYFPGIETIELSRNRSNWENFLLIKRKVGKADLVLDLQRSARTIFIGRMLSLTASAKYISWQKYSLGRALYVLQARLRGRSRDITFYKKKLLTRREAMAQCTLRGLAKLNINSTDHYSDFFPMIPAGQIKDHHVAICLGSLYALKALSFPKIKEFLAAMIPSGPTKIFFLGDADQKPLAEKLMCEFAYANFENLCGKTTLPEAAGVLATCRLALANDSALAHLSEAVGTPVLMFFGPTNIVFGYKPYLPQSMHFRVDLSCSPCHKNGNTNCRYADELCKSTVNMHPVNEYAKTLLHA